MKDETVFHYKPYNRGKYFVASPFRYPGGKYYALKHIMPFLECVPHKEYREPFAGGGSVYFAKEKSLFNWLNDLEKKIMNVYSVISDPAQCQALADKIIKEVATRERHIQMKEMKPRSSFEDAFKTYYLNRTSYCGIINRPAWGYAEGKSSPPPNWGKFLLNAGKKLDGVKLTTLDFERVIETPSCTGKTEDVLMYLDPPYFHTDQKRAYTRPFQLSDHERLSTILRKTEFRFCLSYDNCSEIADLYSWAYRYNVAWLYCTDNKKGAMRNMGNELIITNYKVESDSLFPLC